jgi:nucleoside permease NupC
MTFMPMVRVLAGPVERPFRYLLTASILAPLAVLILAAMINREHLIDAATMEARKTVDVLHEHTLKVMETQLDFARFVRLVDLRH